MKPMRSAVERPCSECGDPFRPYRERCETCTPACGRTRAKRIQREQYAANVGPKVAYLQRKGKPVTPALQVPPPQPGLPVDMDADIQALANWQIRYEPMDEMEVGV